MSNGKILARCAACAGLIVVCGLMAVCSDMESPGIIGRTLLGAGMGIPILADHSGLGTPAVFGGMVVQFGGWTALLYGANRLLHHRKARSGDVRA